MPIISETDDDEDELLQNVAEPQSFQNDAKTVKNKRRKEDEDEFLEDSEEEEDEEEDDDDEEFEDEDYKRKKAKVFAPSVGSRSSSRVVSAPTLPPPPPPPKEDFFKPPPKKEEKQLPMPKGNNQNLVHFDSVNIPTGDYSQIEKYLHSRLAEDGSTELLVKYKNMSHLNAKWIPVSVLEQDKSLRQRITRFLDKSSLDTQWSEDEAFNPAYGKIDRLIDEGDLDGHLHYLVKWCALQYDQSTWESVDTIKELDPDKITEFIRNRTITNARIVSYSSSGRKAPIGQWKKLPESPTFKEGCTLRSYQLEGLNWLMYCWFNKQSSILADEMGLGKTVQSTAFLYQLYRTQNIKGPFLIIVPLSTMGNWERELKLWSDMNVVVYHGNSNSRNLLVETEFYFRDAMGNLNPSIFKFDVLLTTYEMAISGAAQLRPIKWQVCILDEAHKLKNKNAKVTEFLKAYTMEHKVLLTGTPLQNSLDELWALLNFLEPERFPSDKEFLLRYGNMSSASDVENLQLLIKPLMLRRLKEDVEKTIPIKEETIVEVELTTTQKKWYRSILEKNFAWLKQGTKKNNVPQLVNTMIELRKCCIHPWLLKGAEEQILSELNTGDSMDLQMKALVQSSGKMVLIDKLLTKLKAGDHKVLIFSQMTKCLDLIQEYVKHKDWNYERIDGGVRGDYRQAAIDRFSAPGSDSFIFLLCTKAGGVGINLTAADTCIIFDSDWNPQNDLQAQSRLHRIGQKKSVKIYRLITRNTYEREMFDRASMKLGLDRALLQRSTDADPFDSKSKSTGSLSKQEVEDLLKKGAYGAFMDDGAGDKFCEEDIDQILERRTMVIRHDGDSEARKGSMFSKASFQSQGSSGVDVNDPNFWDRIAEEAELEVVDELPEENLIVAEPRNRKQTSRMIDNIGEIDTDPSEDFKILKPTEAKLWSTTERIKLERAVMLHGFSMWEEMGDFFPRRSPQHLKACVRALILRCLAFIPTLDKEIVKDVKRAIAIFYPVVPSPTGEAAGDATATDFNEKEIELLEIPEQSLPWPKADSKEKYEYKSFLKDAPPDYLEHLSKKAKNLLIRVALLYEIRHKMNPSKEMFMPVLAGGKPASWWGPEQDRDLLIGICRHGYQQYTKIWRDPDLCFSKIIPNLATEGGEGVDGPEAEEEEEGVEGPSTSIGAKLEEPEQDAMEVDTPEAIDSASTPPMEVDEGGLVKNEGAMTIQIPLVAPAERAGGATDKVGAVTSPAIYVPTPTELGLRIRKIILGLNRYRVHGDRKRNPKQTQRLKEGELTKRAKLEFQKTILAFGIERNEDGTPNWDNFKVLAELTNRSDESLTHYLDILLPLSRRTIEYCEKFPPKKGAAASAADDARSLAELMSTYDYPKDDGEPTTFDRAKKIVKRVEMFDKLRREVLKLPDLETRLAGVQKHGLGGMPKWWDLSLDLPLLKGIDRFGLTRGDSLIDDPTLPFKEIHAEYQKSLILRFEKGMKPTELIDGKFEEKFWMRDSACLKRVELLITIAEKPGISPKRPGRPRTNPIGDPSAMKPKPKAERLLGPDGDGNENPQEISVYPEVYPGSELEKPVEKKKRKPKKVKEAAMLPVEESLLADQLMQMQGRQEQEQPQTYNTPKKQNSLASLIHEEEAHHIAHREDEYAMEIYADRPAFSHEEHAYYNAPPHHEGYYPPPTHDPYYSAHLGYGGPSSSQHPYPDHHYREEYHDYDRRQYEEHYHQQNAQHHEHYHPHHHHQRHHSQSPPPPLPRQGSQSHSSLPSLTGSAIPGIHALISAAEGDEGHPAEQYPPPHQYRSHSPPMISPHDQHRPQQPLKRHAPGDEDGFPDEDHKNARLH